MALGVLLVWRWPHSNLQVDLTDATLHTDAQIAHYSDLSSRRYGTGWVSDSFAQDFAIVSTFTENSISKSSGTNNK